MCRREDVTRLLDCVFNLARDKKACQGRILVIVLGVAEVKAELVVVSACGVECTDGSGIIRWRRM